MSIVTFFHFCELISSSMIGKVSQPTHVYRTFCFQILFKDYVNALHFSSLVLKILLLSTYLKYYDVHIL